MRLSSYSSARSRACERNWLLNRVIRMANASLIEQLDEAVQAIIADPDLPLPAVDASIADLLSVAVELRDLPRPEFRRRLRADLQRSWSPATPAANPIREGLAIRTS